uniref:IS91 family transposase n=1 Tax=Clostridium estertheticum TaxID=238834 RepID=UPI00299F5281|nr:transposase [Clostridium estertheticum]
MVYCKPPFGSAEHVLEYLGRYSHRVAISNHRIANLENGYVTFKWRDYKYHNKEKFMTLTVDEFMRRLFMHVLPRKFVKIRHYGILSNRNRGSNRKTRILYVKTYITKTPIYSKSSLNISVF